MPPTVVTVTAPKPPTPSAVEEGLLPASEARGKWFYTHMPRDYEFVDEKWGFLPNLCEQYAVAGVNGVREVMGPNGKVIGVDDAGLRAGLLRKGATILDPMDPSLGPWHKYVRAYNCVGGGKAYVFSVDKGGVTYSLFPGGMAVAHDASDLLREFRAWLVENGKIPPIPKPVYDFLMELENVALQRQIKAASTNPHLSKRVEERQARISAMRTVWDQMHSTPATPAPERPVGPVGPVRLSAPVAA